MHPRILTPGPDELAATRQEQIAKAGRV